MNFAGVLATAQALVRPAILQPRLVVPDISALDWAAFKARGVRGVVIDKDNCITRPAVDELFPALRPAWTELLRTFGPANVLVVSNSAGTAKDSLLLQAESVSRELRVPVLVHTTPKPGHRCARGVVRYFLPPPPEEVGVLARWTGRQSRECRDGGAFVWKGKERELSPHDPPLASPDTLCLLVIGDRLTTDMVLSHRLNSLASRSHPLPFPVKIKTIPILTTTLHAREGLGTTILRTLERAALWRLSLRRPAVAAALVDEDWGSCVRAPPRLAPPTRHVTLAGRVRALWHEFCSIPATDAEQATSDRVRLRWAREWRRVHEAGVAKAERAVLHVEEVAAASRDRALQTVAGARRVVGRYLRPV